MGYDVANNCVICSRKSECFKYLTRKELCDFNNSKTTINYSKGETIIKQGTEFTHVISFNAGLAKLMVEIALNKNIMIGLLQPSEILGGPGMFADNRYSFTVKALTDSTICLINVESFKAIFRSNSDFANSFLASFSSRFILSINRLVNISHKQMHGRVADALLYFADTIYNSDSFELAISRQDMAEFTGMTKESISRILNDFNKEQIIISKGRNFEILNKEKLIHFRKTG